MLLVFGWTPHNLDEGPVVTCECQGCGETAPWHLHSVTMWISLLFVRVLPTGTEYWLRCQSCGNGFELGDERNALIRRGDPADDPTVMQWIRQHGAPGPARRL